ncbi:MAG TPA: beta-N-acetylhexosaminidase [Fimbriimonadaceae bacterium]|nr:beta-N-acetylhexosaminidase [Fimbriimonadaceae bacterium]
MAFLIAAAFLTMSAQPQPISIIPEPAHVEARTGAFHLNSRTSIYAPDSLGDLAHYAQRCLAPATGFYFPIIDHRGPNTIEMRLDKHAEKLGPEGYFLEVDKDRVLIHAARPVGLFYGFQSLRQLLPPDIFRKARMQREWTAPCVYIEDSPRFGWRGAMVDSSRHFMPKEFILKFIDLMALHKLNVFHWHLVDDPGWRIEIKGYPRLTANASQTDFSEMNPTMAMRSINQKPGGFYTQDDIREVIRYAQDRFITIIPEIEMPGHSNAAISAYPELGNKQELEAAGIPVNFMGSYDNVYNVEDSTIQFLKNVLDEVMDLFPSKFIHIGGDEVWKEPWHENPKVQERMKALGLKNEEELQSWFIKQFDTYLTSKGRRLIGWDEILEGGLAPGAAVMSWRGIGGGIAAAKSGHDVVMAPNSDTYLDHYQSKLQSREPKAIGGYLPLSKVYAFEPIPAALSSEEAKHVLGGQAQLWSEFIPHPKHMEYMAYPRLCALSEAVWSPKSERNWQDFLTRLDVHLKRLSVLDVNFRPLNEDPKPVGQWKNGEVNDKFADKEWDITPALTNPGDYDVIFSYSWGEDRLDIQWIEIREDGQVVQRVEHLGRTGADNKDNAYRIHLDHIKPGAKYTLRASVRADGGDKSNGDIYIVPAR